MTRLAASFGFALLGVMLVATIAQAGACGARKNCCEWVPDGSDPDKMVCTTSDGPVFNPASRRVALVIGTDAYGHEFGDDIEDLENAVNDAVRLGDELDSIGFDVRYALNPSRKWMRQEIRELLVHMGRTDLRVDTLSLDDIDELLSVVYIAGHGFSFKETEIEGSTDFLIFRPVRRQETQITSRELFEQSRISTSSIERDFGEFIDFKAMFLFDACRSLKDFSEETKDKKYRGQIPGVYSNQNLDIYLTKNVLQFSTSELYPASDVSDVANSGQYMATLGRLLGARGVSPLALLNSTRYLVKRASGNIQTPSSVQNTGVWMFDPLVESRNRCEATTSELWETFGTHCNALNSTCQRRICQVYDRFDLDQVACDASFFEQTAIGGVSLASYCGGPTPPAADESPVASVINLQSTPFAAGIDNLEQIIFPLASTQIAGVTNLQYGIGQEGTSLDLSRPQIDAISPEVLRDRLLRTELDRRAGLPVAAGTDFRLRGAPTESARVLIQDLDALGGEPRVWLDCKNVPCGAGWLGITVYDTEKEEYTRGFVEANEVSWRDPDETSVLELKIDDIRLSKADISTLHSFTSKAIRSDGTVQLSLRFNQALGFSSDFSVLSLIENIIGQVRVEGEGLSPANLIVTRIPTMDRNDIDVRVNLWF